MISNRLNCWTLLAIFGILCADKVSHVFNESKKRRLPNAHTMLR